MKPQYKIIAGLFDYPQEGYLEKFIDIQNYLHQNYPETNEDIDKFIKLVPQDDLQKCGELFTRSFDVQAVTTLDVGYVLFGDDYKRGELLVNLNREHKQANNETGIELADHLPNVLRLMALIEDSELEYELVEEIILPALNKMISEFQPERLKKRNEMYKKHYKTLIDFDQDAYTMYLNILNVLEKVLQKDFKIVHKVEREQTVDFLKSLNTEMEIETQENLQT